MFNINFDDDWIRTGDLWIYKRLLYQLCHNHFPGKDYWIIILNKTT